MLLSLLIILCNHHHAIINILLQHIRCLPPGIISTKIRSTGVSGVYLFLSNVSSYHDNGLSNDRPKRWLKISVHQLSIL